MLPPWVRAALIAMSIAQCPLPAFAQAAPVATVTVSQTSSEAGVTLRLGSRLRITAAGNLSFGVPPPGCAVVVGPRGCSADSLAGKPVPYAPAAALIGTFVDTRGIAIAQPFFIGEAALVVAPAGAAHLLLRANAPTGGLAGAGSFTVTTATVPDLATLASPPQQSAGTKRSAMGTRRISPIGRLTVDGVMGRAAVAHLLRRFTFGATPATIDSVMRSGVDAWLSAQLAPQSIDDSAAIAALQPKPTTTDAKGRIVDYDVYERRLVQRQFATARQLQEKMVMHWLDHFSIGNGKVADPSLMSHYEETLRADALGNFKQLVVDVTKEPAMLYWLDNNRNSNASPANPPNENYARELMQLFVMGTDRLNLDGSPQLDSSGTPVPNYSQTDVTTVAAGLSGLSVLVDYTGGKDPNTRFSVTFDPKKHVAATRTLVGTTYADPSDPAAIDATIDVLIRHPSTAPFQVKELLQRFVTPNPSPQYLAAVAQVWQQNVDAPDQIARVVRAIVTNPEFLQSAHSMTKEPMELTMAALRALPFTLKTATNGSAVTAAGADLAGSNGTLAKEAQEPYNAPSVFSFYRPGHKESLLSQQSYLQRSNDLTRYVQNDAADPRTDVGLDLTKLRAAIGSTDPQRITDYLLDALVAGEAPAMRQSVLTYLANGTDDAHLRGAVWLIVTSPEFEVA